MTDQRHASQVGAAVITALFVVALVAGIVSSAMRYQSLHIARARLVTQRYRLYWAAQIALRQTQQQLKQRFKRQDQQPILVSELARSVASINGVQLQVSVKDLTGRFNLNNLSQPRYEVLFQHLLSIVLPTLSPAERGSIILAIQTMVQPKKKLPTQRLPEKPTIKQQAFHHEGQPVRSSSLPRPVTVFAGIRSVSRLRALPQLSRQAYLHLAPYLTALPTVTPINVNAASPELLQALMWGVDRGRIDALIQQRRLQPFRTVEQFLKAASGTGSALAKSFFSVQGSYLLVSVRAQIAEQSLQIYSILAVKAASDHDPTVNMVMIWQTQSRL